MKSKVKQIFVCLSAALLLTSTPVKAQQPVKVPRIGYFSSGSFSDLSARVEAFRQGLRELGYIEGKNIVIEWRYGEENLTAQTRL